MNNYKELLNLVNENNKKLNGLYDDLDSDIIKKALEICKFSGEKSQKIAILRRIVDLKPDPLLIELKKVHKDNQKILKYRDEMYEFTAQIHTNLHEELIEKINKANILDDFNLNLLKNVHNIGIIFNEMQKKWQEIVVDKNSELFSKIQNPYEFIKENKLYQISNDGLTCDRSYGVALFENESVKFVPYSIFFGEFNLEEAFDETIHNLNKVSKTPEHASYVKYFEKLKEAFLQTDDDKVISSWQEAEIAWMDVKGDLQVGHPLEYYEDAYTHAVALEWDIRLKESSSFDENKFKKEILESFDKVYKNINAQNPKMYQNVVSNIDKTQLYISTPMIYYGAEMNGLFSAQVVPNDEFVSNKCGKKIFAFVNFVYESSKAKPFMKLSSIIFEKKFLDYGREILFKKPEIWRKVYEVSTIGHEFGHIFFIDNDTENSMNKNGLFKLIEEYKATTGGLVNFFFHEKEELKMPVFNELIKRSVGLIVWQKVDEVKPYYCEGLIHLSLLFQSNALSFENDKLSVNFSNNSYEKFKTLCLQNYETLAKIYYEKIDASEFLNKFCILENGVYLPINKNAKEFVVYYAKLYDEIGNEVDENSSKQEWL